MESTKHGFSTKDWSALIDFGCLKQAIEFSNTKPVAIFKHSTRCGISAAAQERLELDWNIPMESLTFYHLDLLAHRDVSNEIANRLNITHQCPQLIVIYKGQVVYVQSHHAITLEGLRGVVNKLKASTEKDKKKP